MALTPVVTAATVGRPVHPVVVGWRRMWLVVSWVITAVANLYGLLIVAGWVFMAATIVAVPVAAVLEMVGVMTGRPIDSRAAWGVVTLLLFGSFGLTGYARLRGTAQRPGPGFFEVAFEQWRTAGGSPAAVPAPVAVAEPAIVPLSRSEPINAVRAWSVGFEPARYGSDRIGMPYLQAVNQGAAWPSPEMVAECRKARHAAPAVTCTCGIYALKEGVSVPDYARRGAWVSGTVHLSGRVVEAEYGYRAERARIVGPLILHMAPAARALVRDQPTGRLVPSGAPGERWPQPLAGDQARTVAARLELRYGVTVTWKGDVG